ncbi:helix-turn-helix domain-containing protein [Litorihabitans aurantiacus]|uniref:Helix-turn-helix domain-containing protein n=1 Tax=Litorihabitans aurantiacus TaxID=1930061 RepID=A0AA38CWJ4_9MICO|nr:helix-turn-helix domain-containing protein [Litorihabitans aurantiacus]GMA33490.1 hypothetical protein GCM10025875_34820 [Litorihabitans aurantiacus]GMA33604.1 hypothetical protein GCM10025875_35960 [Litorihabitans aurantiacus]
MAIALERHTYSPSGERRSNEVTMVRVPINDEPRMLSAKEVADRLQVETTWVTRQASDGLLPGFRLGKRWRFDPIEIADWLVARQNRLVPEAPPMRRRFADYPMRPVDLDPPASIDLRDHLTSDQVADAIRVPVGAVRGWIQSGLLPGYHVSRKWFVAPAVYDEMVEILRDGERLALLAVGGARTGWARDCLESEMLDRRNGFLHLTPESHRRGGGPPIRWVNRRSQRSRPSE